jgi:hypothetical protein
MTDGEFQSQYVRVEGDNLPLQCTFIINHVIIAATTAKFWLSTTSTVRSG